MVVCSSYIRGRLILGMWCMKRCYLVGENKIFELILVVIFLVYNWCNVLGLDVSGVVIGLNFLYLF